MFTGHRLAWFICLLFFLAWVCLLDYKYYNLGYDDWDLAFFSQACWQLLHGSQYTSLTGINYFGDHSYFITALVLPIFALVPHPLTLVSLKLMAFFVAAFLFYKMAYESLGQATALVLMVLYILFPANIFSILYEFNPEAVAPPVLFWIFMSFQKQRWRSFLIASVLLMLIKENMCLIVCAFGLYGLFSKDCPPKIAWGALLSGAVLFYVLVIDVVPYFRHLSYHPFVVRYAYLGHSIPEILFHSLTQPQKIAGALFSGVNGGYIFALFGPLIVPVLFTWQVLLLSLPLLLQHLLSSQQPEHTIYYYYGATIAPFIFWALLRTLSFCHQNFDGKIFRAVMALLFFVSIVDLYGYFNMFDYRLNYHHDHLDAVRWAFIDAVPPQAGVIATFAFLAPLSLRKDAYSFHKVYAESFQNPQKIKLSELNTGASFVLPEQVHYALIDLNDLWLHQALKKKPQVTSERIRAFLQNDHWKVIRHFGSMELLTR